MTITPVPPETFHIFDTTLRDGAQQEGMQLSVSDKLKIAGYLDELGVTFIEGGWPGANPADTAFFAEAQHLGLRRAELVAFGETRRAGGRAADDPLVAALRDAGTSTVCLVAESHAGHVERVLRASLAENVEMVRDTVAHLVGEGKRVFVDCEHFFDGYRCNPAYALEVVRAAAESGAEVVVLCDTSGGMLPSAMGDVVGATSAIGVDLGVHCHNDTGCAVANTIAAVEAGVMHVQGTINGYGERTGNADLTCVIPNLQLKFGWPLLPPEQLAELTRISHAIAAVTSQPAQRGQPYVGASSFARRGAPSAARVDEASDQHVDPALVGNRTGKPVSAMAGRASIQVKGEQLGFDVSDRDLAATITVAVQEREARGYAYETADASFELLLREQLGVLPQVFEVRSWRVLTGQRAGGETVSEATVELTVSGRGQATVGEGNGPLDALDSALRQALSSAYPQVNEYELTDYRVRILADGHGTEAIVRTFIDTVHGECTWTTLGVGTNVVEASWEALTEAYRYGLTRVARD
ncbi:MAG: citramalate synthase [Propionibacteriaceae bacterium]|nr:citramalate synthase [Propionibacteriaceae bacterium]